MADPTSTDKLHAFLFSITSLPKDILGQNKWACPVQCFIAALAIQHNQTFMLATEITPYLARLKYAMRSIVYSQCLQDAPHHPEGFAGASEEHCKQLLNLQVSSSFSILSELDVYASSIAMSTPSAAQIAWSEDRRVVAYKEKKLSMAKLQSGIKLALGDAKSLLDQLCYGHSFPVNIPEDFQDDMTEMEFGYSYLDRVKCFPDHALFHALVQDRECPLITVDGSGKAGLNFPEAAKWFGKCAELNKLLGCLAHITGGQPGRGTEITDVRIRNRSRLRNIMHSFGKMLWIYNYSKTSNNTGSDSYIPHQIPDCLAPLINCYLLVIRPLETLLSKMIYNEDISMLYQEYFWVQGGKHINSDTFSDQLGSFTHSYCGVKLKLLAWRHIAVAIKREYIPQFYYNHRARGDDIGDLQAGHSSSTADRVYGIREDGLFYLNTQALAMHAQYSRRWHDALGVGLNPPGPALCFHPQYSWLPHDTFTYSNPLADHPQVPSTHDSHSSLQPPSATGHLQLQAMIKNVVESQLEEHSRVVEKMIQQAVSNSIASALLNFIGKDNRSNNQQETNIPNPPSSFAPTSDIQEELWLNSAPSAPPALPPTLACSGPNITVSSDEKDILECMAQTYGRPMKSISWKSDAQRDLLLHIFQSQENVVGILPTGGGKSAAFEVACHTWQRHQTTVVVVPFRTLLDQFYANSMSRGTNVIHYTNAQSYHTPQAPPPSLILVSAEVAVKEKFIQ